MSNQYNYRTEEEKKAIRMQGYMQRDQEIAASRAARQQKAEEATQADVTSQAIPRTVPLDPRLRNRRQPVELLPATGIDQIPRPPPPAPVLRQLASVIASSGTDELREQDYMLNDDPLAGESNAPNALKRTVSGRDGDSSKRINGQNGGDLSKEPTPATGGTISSMPSFKRRPEAVTASSSRDIPTSLDGDVRADHQLAPPSWYLELPKPTTRGKSNEPAVDALLAQLKTRISECLNAPLNSPTLSKNLDILRQKLHQAAFAPVNPSMLRANRLLHFDGGLPSIIKSNSIFPYDIRADAHELYNKWAARNFETDLLHGIKTSTTKTASSASSLVPNYAHKRNANFHGAGDLMNGQWWPTQLAALRDGAHGASQAGISGETGKGAFSVVMSGGHDYPDVDRGNEVLYCGTDSSDGEITAATRMLLENVGNPQTPVRVLRSAQMKGKSVFAPSLGFRYDGLYDVVGVEVLDRTKQRHRFRLVRKEGQDPIRGGGEPGSRPNEVEVAKWQQHKGFLKGEI